MDTEYKEKENVSNRNSSFNYKELVFRLLALSLTLVAAVVLGVDKQTTTVSLTLVPSLPPVDLPVTAKWTDLSAFVYVIPHSKYLVAYNQPVTASI